MDQQVNNNQPVRRSRRLATIIPASHWVSIGYSVEDAEAMEKLQNDMKRYCDGGEEETFIELKGNLGSILPHHDTMLPHWKKLCKSLSSTVEDLRIYDISMPVSVLDIVFPALQSTDNLTKLCLCDANMGNEGLLRVADFLKENSSLKRLLLGDKIDDLSIASELSDAFNNHPSLDGVGFSRLGLNRCGLNNIEILEKILEGCKRMKRLVMTGEGLGSEAVAAIEDIIRSNHPTESFILVGNNISDNDTLLLASALKQNTNLKKLDLQKNDITEEGEKTLLNALFDTSSMDSIIESNHTCVPLTYDYKSTTAKAQRPPLEKEVLKINRGDSIDQKIRQKVVLALCGVDGELFDLSYLNDLPLPLMPRVLELIQEHTRTRTKACRNKAGQLEKDSLTRLFYTLRGWELPLLFENLSPKKGTAGKRKKRKTRR